MGMGEGVGKDGARLPKDVVLAMEAGWRPPLILAFKTECESNVPLGPISGFLPALVTSRVPGAVVKIYLEFLMPVFLLV